MGWASPGAVGTRVGQRAHLRRWHWRYSSFRVAATGPEKSPFSGGSEVTETKDQAPTGGGEGQGGHQGLETHRKLMRALVIYL